MRILLSANIRVLLRDRQSLFWALIFPVMLLVFFSLFSLDDASRTDLAVGGAASSFASQELIAELQSVDFVEEVDALTEAEALELLDDDDADMALLLTDAAPAVDAVLLYTDDDPISRERVIAAIEGVADGLNVRLSGAPRTVRLTARAADADADDFFDFLAPGVLGLAVMSFGVVGMAASLARYRELGVLRRVRATPLPPWRFFTGMVGGYLAVAALQIAVLVVVARLLGAGHIFDGLPAVVLLLLLGTIIFLNLGVIVAGMVTGTYAAEAAANAVSLPMMFFAGTFFPVDSLPGPVQVLVQALPLTHLLDAIRAVSLDGEPVWEQAPQIAILLGWVVGSFFVARRVFRLEDA